MDRYNTGPRRAGTAAAAARRAASPFLALPMALVSGALPIAAMLAVPVIAPPAAFAQESKPKTIRIGVTSDTGVTKYELSKPAKFKPKRDKDGNIVARAKVTLYYLLPPEPKNVSKAEEDKEGISGKDLGLPPDGFREEGVNLLAVKEPSKTGEKKFFIASPDRYLNEDTLEIVHDSGPKLTPREELYNRLRRGHLKRMKFPELLTGAAKEGDRASRVDPAAVKQERLFAFGDLLYNSRNALSLALRGTASVTRAPRIAGVTVLDPKEIDDAKAVGASINIDSMRDRGRWYFDEVTTTYTIGGKPVKVPMVRVRAVWAFEATFTPEDEGKAFDFEFVNVSVPNAEASKGGQTAPANTPAQPAAQNAANFQQLTFGLPAGIFAPGGAPASRPGLDFVAGVAIQDNGQPGLLGINVYYPKNAAEEALRPRLFDRSRVSLLLAKGQSEGERWIIAPGVRLNSQFTLFAGPQFGSGTGGGSRTSLTFGGTISLTPLVTTPPANAGATAVPELEIATAQDIKLAYTARSEEANAVIFWTAKKEDDATTAQQISPFVLISDPKPVAKKNYGPTDKGSPAANEQRFWVSYVPTGEITGLKYDITWNPTTGQPSGGMDYDVENKPVKVEAGKRYIGEITLDKSDPTKVKKVKITPQ